MPVVAVLAEVPSARAQMADAVARGAAGQVRPGESLCVRLHKRGAHGYLDLTLRSPGNCCTSSRARHRPDPAPPVSAARACSGVWPGAWRRLW